MGKLFYFSILACIALGFGACREQPPAAQHADDKSEVAPDVARAPDAHDIEPDQIVRFSPEVVEKKQQQGRLCWSVHIHPMLLSVRLSFRGPFLISNSMRPCHRWI